MSLSLLGPPSAVEKAVKIDQTSTLLVDTSVPNNKDFNGEIQFLIPAFIADVAKGR